MGLIVTLDCAFQAVRAVRRRRGGPKLAAVAQLLRHRNGVRQAQVSERKTAHQGVTALSLCVSLPVQ